MTNWMKSAMLSLLWSLAMVAAGCSEDASSDAMDTGNPDTATLDGGAIDTGDAAPADSALDGALADTGSDGGDSTEGARWVMLTTSDFSEGELAALKLDDGELRVAASKNADQDSIVNSNAGQAFLIERGNGIIKVLDPSDPVTVINSIDVNPPSAAGTYAANPSAVVATSATKAYVVREALNTIAVIDPTQTGAAALIGEIDLSSLVLGGDSDGIVDAVGAHLVGDTLYVALGRFYFDFDTFELVFPGTSAVAIIDTTSDTLSGSVELALTNPIGGMVADPSGSELWVGCVGQFAASDGGIERIRLADHSNTGVLITEETLGGDLHTVTRHGQSGFVAANDVVVRFDATTGEPHGSFSFPSAGATAATNRWVYFASGTALRGIEHGSSSTWVGTSAPEVVSHTVGTLPVYGLALLR